MISTVTIGRGNRARTAIIPSSHKRDLHRSLRQDAANILKDYLFGPFEQRNRARNKAFKRGKSAQGSN